MNRNVFSKKTTIKEIQRISTDEESDVSMNCSCQILLDTSLSNVGQSDCTCSDCLQANLEAFNDFKQRDTMATLRYEQQRSMSQSSLRSNLHQGDSIQGNRNSKNAGRNSSVRGYKTTTTYENDKRRTASNAKYKPKYYVSDYEQEGYEGDYYNYEPNDTSQNLNDYILVTKQRTRKYLEQRKKAGKQDSKRKQELKNRIKQNLEILKYTAKSIRQKEDPQREDSRSKQDPSVQGSVNHSFKWNHTPYSIADKQKKSCCHNMKHIPSLNTNLEAIKPEFAKNRDEILENAKRQRQESMKQPECHVKRYSQKKNKKTEKFITEQANKYMKQQKEKKLKEEQNQKIKKAKLRAIELKSKDILKKTKKFDAGISRTSFQLSADHFSTFSELRDNKQEMDKERKYRKESRKDIKQNGGRIAQAIYEDLEDDLEEDSGVSGNNKIKGVSGRNYGRQQQPNHYQRQQQVYQQQEAERDQIQQKKQWCEKITKDAKIISPKAVKKSDKKQKEIKMKEDAAMKGQQQKQAKKKTHLTIVEQQKRQRQAALQNERRKRELMQEYKRQKQINQHSKSRVEYDSYLEGNSRASMASSKRAEKY